MSEPSGFPGTFPKPPRDDGVEEVTQQWGNDLLGRLQQPMNPGPGPAGFPLAAPPQPAPSTPPPQPAPPTPQAQPRSQQPWPASQPQPAGHSWEQTPGRVLSPPPHPTTSPHEPLPAQQPHEGEPQRPTLRDHPDYARLSKRNAVPGWRRALGWFTRIFRSDDVASRVTRASAGAQRPVTTGRRLVVLGASGGTGTTSVAVGLARTLAAVRNAPTALVAIDDNDDLSSRLDVAPVPPARSDLPATDFAAQMSAMTESGRIAAIRPHEDAAAMARGLGRFFAVTVIDAGQHPPAQLTSEAHAVVIVASASAAGTTAVTRTVAGLHAAGTNPKTILVVLVPRLPGDEVTRHAQHLRASGITTFVLPHDRHIAGGAALHLRLAAENTQVILGELAAATMNPPDR